VHILNFVLGKGAKSAKKKKRGEGRKKMTNEELDKLSNKVRGIGIGIKVHKQLGPGFVEKIYESALEYEFKKVNIPFKKQKIIKVKYEGLELGNQRIDFLIENKIIVEIKSVSQIIEQIIEQHQHQMISYLKTSNKKLGLILNFGKKKLEIKRLVNNF